MNYKSTVMKICKLADIKYEVENSDWIEEKYYVLLDAPEGFRFEPELHMLVCHSWEDACLRLQHYLIQGLESCCDGKCGDVYECHGVVEE
jgi:hypothetical protein